MTRPVCTDTGCERSVVRYRDGAGYCLFHPDAQPPVIDPKTGRPVVTTPLKVKATKPRPEPATRKPRRAPARVVQRPAAAKPTPADVAMAYDGATDLVDSMATQSWHNKATNPGRGGRRRNPIDPADAARRYRDGEGLFPLAADLHVGVKTLREVLAGQGVQLRKRGDVIGTRGPGATPIDPDECQRLYASGLNTTQIARQLHVKTNRVQTLLRELGVLRPPGGRPPGAAALNAVRLKLTREESAAVRLRAATLGQPINHYLRGLVLADLATTGSAEEVA